MSYFVKYNFDQPITLRLRLVFLGSHLQYIAILALFSIANFLDFYCQQCYDIYLNRILIICFFYCGSAKNFMKLVT